MMNINTYPLLRQRFAAFTCMVFWTFAFLTVQNAYSQCPVPTSLATTSITNSSAKVTWTAVTGVVATYSWWVTNGAGSQTLASGTTASAFANVSGLPASTDCKVYVQTLCSSPSGTSAAIGPVSFETGCAPVNVPVSENLSGVTAPNLPSCWTVGNLYNNGASWETNNGALRVSKYWMNDWLWTGGISMEANVPYEISFTYSGNSATGATFSLSWGTTPTPADMNVTPITSVALSTQSGTYTGTFTPTTTGNYYFGWLASRQSSASQMAISLDNITIRPQGCINAPVVNTITTVTANTATATWTNISGTTGYEWKVVLAGSGVGASAVQTGSVSAGITTVTATGLLGGISYDFYLRGKCGTGNNSNWSNLQGFATTSGASLVASANNDAFIKVDWSLPVNNCLLNGSGQPYPQGVYLALKDATGQVLYQTNVPDLSQYVGTQQPTFGAVLNTNGANAYRINNGQLNQNQDVPYWTVEGWTLTNSGMSNAQLYSNWITSGNNQRLAIRFINAQQIGVALNRGTNAAGVGANYNFPTVIPAGVWTHVAVTCNGSKLQLYLNGDLKSELTVSALDMPYLTLKNGSGNFHTICDQYAFGYLGELRLWNRVRTAVELKNNRFLTSFVGIAQTNMLLWLRWNSVGGGTSAVDAATVQDGAATIVNTNTTIAYSATPNYTPLVGSFSHYVGAGQSKTYTLNTYQIGSAAPTVNCSVLTATGSTTAFQPPVQMAATDNGLNKVTLSWKNKSKLSETFKIYRNGTLRAVIAGTTQIDSVVRFEEAYTEGDSLSIASGTSYNYCVETYSNTLLYTSPSQVCDMGGTVSLNFAATDNAFPNKVNMSWNNLSTYGYTLQIQRNGTALASLPSSATSYTDESPIYGKNSTYTLALIDVTSGNVVVAASNTGSVAARGAISGRVLTNEGNYAIRGATISLHSLVDTAFHATTTSDMNGNYAFTGLYYDIDGDFVLTATYSNHPFYDNKRTINLLDTYFAKTNIDFRDSIGFTVSNTPLAITNFLVAPIAIGNRVYVNWKYVSVANDTSLFDVYREDVLIGSVSNVSNGLAQTYLFADLTGMPNANYIYKLVGYRIQNGTVYTKTLKDTLAFPIVAAPTSLAAAPNSTLGVVNLTWANSSTNYLGYNLYRNGVLITSPLAGITTYTDDNATPGTTYTYLLKNKRGVDGVTYESVGVTATALAPVLPTISTLNATSSTTRHSVSLTWTVPVTLQNASYNFDGYRIYRGATLIGILPKGISTYTFEDKTAPAALSQTYTVRTYAILTDSTYAQSGPANKVITSPVVFAATGISATKTSTTPKVGEVKVRWTNAMNNAAVRNVDGQVLIATLGGINDSIFLNPRVTSYRYFTNSIATYTFAVRTYRVANGTKYFSTNLSTTGNAIAGVTNPPLPTNFKASQDLSNQVRLSWDYPIFGLSTFNIYRDSVLLATLPTTARSFQDTSASNWINHFYQIEAVYGTTAQRVGAIGNAKSHYVLTGRVYSQTGQYGMAGVDIYVTATQFFARAKTDSTGFYQIEIPAQPAQTITVMADAFNTALTQSLSPYVVGSLAAVQTFVTNTQDEKYQVNFASSFTPTPTNLQAPAKISYFMATADAAQRSVSLTCRLVNDDYEGIEVYRANVLLATILKGSPLIAYDMEGVPGISYVYQIRSFKTVNNVKTYSDYKGYEATFPVLEAPRHATAQLLANGIRIEWAHTWDNHTGYIVERNGSPVATLNTGDALIYEDYSGLPNQQYIYSIRAALKVANAFYYSEATEIQVSFPDIKDVSNLSVTTPTQNVTGLDWAANCNTATTRAQNHVLLSWAYPSDNANGYLVYRDDAIIATLPKDTMMYRDFEGIPNVVYTYKVQAIKQSNGITYNSLGIASAATLFPNLATAYNLETKDTLGMIRYTWRYTETGATGFLIKIKDYPAGNIIDIDTITVGENGLYTYWHKDGLPNAQYAYQVQAYTVRNSVTYFSDNSQCAKIYAYVFGSYYNGSYDWAYLTYPNPVAPITVAATDGTYSSYVKVTWAYSPISEISGFEVYRNGIKVGETAAGLREFNDLVFTPATPYTVKAYRLIGATRYFSAASTADNGNSQPLTSSLTSISGASKYGFSLDSYDNMLLVGAPGPNTSVTYGAVQQYIQDAQGNISTGWSDAKYGGFGYSVALSNDMATAIAPSRSTNDKCNVYKFNANAITYTNSFSTSVVSTPSVTAISDLSVSTNSFGIVNTHPMIFGFPTATPSGTNSGAAYIDVYGNNAYVPVGNVTEGQFGYCATVTQRHAVISRPFQASFGLYEYYLANPADGSTWTYLGPLPNPNGISSTPLLGGALSYADDYGLIAGAAYDNGGGKAYYYKRNNTTGNAIDPNTWTAAVAISNPANSNGDRFGIAVDLKGDYAAVGAPGYNGGKGAAYLFKKNSNNQWDTLRSFRYNSIASTGDSIGRSIKIGKHNLYIGAPGSNGGAGKVYIEPLGEVKAGSVTATQGTISAQVRIDWVLIGIEEEIAGFRIFRDGILIGTTGKTDRLYFDATGTAGQRYIYEVAVYHSDMEQRRYPAEGWSKPDGLLEGQVTTLQGGGKVGGVTIKATAQINGSYYNYSTVSDGNGNYHIPEVFYGGGSADYSLSATFRDHEFNENPIDGQLSTSQPSRSYLNFMDKTAYIIGGKVSRRNMTCGLDSIKLTGYYHFADGSTDTLSSVYTNSEGDYSITVNPFLPNLSTISVGIESTRNMSSGGTSSTLHYVFAPQSATTFTVTPNFEANYTLNFLDTLTYPVYISLLNACQAPILGGQYKVRVKDETGCYNQTFVTNNNGYVIANIPPANVNINIEGVVNLNQQTELVANYLRYRPQTLNLYDLYRDTLWTASAGLIDSLTKRTFTYYTPPILSVASGFNQYLCNDPNKAAVVTEDKRYTLSFAVQSNYNGTLCNAKVGHIIINNAAAITTVDTLDFDLTTGAFNKYSFAANKPNLVSPYTYTMSVNYYSPEYELLAVKTFAILVQGTSSLPGSDIIVDLGAADQIKLPLFVLRDPPGDASYSTLEEGVTVNHSFEASEEWSFAKGPHVEVAIGSPFVGFKLEFDMIFRDDHGEQVLSSASITNQQTISTSADELQVGKGGDVIIGTGIALQYGLAQQIKVDSLTGCIIKKNTTLSFKPNSLQTTWMYTTDHIKHLMEGYQVQIEQVKAGTLVLYTNETPKKVMPKEAAVSKLQNYISGWSKVLNYHKKETLPWYDLCAHQVPSYLADAYLTDRKNEVKKWQDAYCLDAKYVKGGKYDASRNFSIPDASFEELPWTDDRIFAYNVARTAIQHLEYVFPLKEQQGQYEDFYDYKGKSDINAPWFIEKWAYKTNALSDKTVGQTFINRAEEIGIMSGTPAKNITFSSGVAYEEQQENTQVESNSFTDNYFFEIDLKAGLYLKSNVAAGFGVVADVFAGEGWLAINFGYHYTRTARYEYGTEKRTASSFHLEDNDPSDQFSVTCIKGVNPHHTPYFSLLGGRSSCPLEEGTIARDNPKIYVYDAASNSVAKSQTLYNQDPDGTANFTLQLSNNNPFNEPREVLLYQELSSNTENSEVRVSGQELGSAGIIYLVYPNQPILVDIGVGKGQDYDITNLIIAVRSSCDLPAGFVNIPTEYITLNAHFQSPCSDIALLTPEQEWQIKRRNPFDVNSREQLLLKMIDYDTDNTKLKSARLEYRRIGANQTWQTLSGSSVSRDSLANWNSLNFLPGALNYYPFVWDITNNYAGFPDGNYEVRAVAECETDGQMYSEVIKGSIYRNTTALGLPQPSDKVWTTGDEISVSYIHDVDCPLGSSFVVKNKTTNLPVNGNVICQNNSIYFEPTDNLKLYDGDSLEMSVTNVMDTQGNSMDSVVWTFKVVSADLYSSNDWINVVIEQGDKIDISTFLVNNTAGGEPLSYQIQGLNPYASWLSTDNATGTVLKGMPEEIMFSIDSKTMPIDTVEAMLSVLANGNTYPNLIKLRIRVLAKSPNWQVNTGIYEQTMSLISNFNFDNTGILSQDSADIISVWIDNQPRGVAHISKLSATLYDALISVYGNTADAGKPLSFRVWDASTGTEYDARPDGNATVTFAANTIKGALTNPLLLDVITATDKARYIPLNQGWTMFSINTDTWNKPINAALSSLKYSQAGNAIKTANKSASFSANTWSSANGLDSMNVHRGYQIYLQHADTLRIAGAAAVIKPIALNQGWNLIGYPLQSETAIGTAMTFLGTPDTMWLKTVAQNPTYSANMIANYYGGTWKSAFNSDMQKLRPNFAYWLKVNTSGSQLKYTGVTVAPPVSLLRVANNGANADPDYPETWGVNPANYEQNMLINASISIDRHWVQDTSSLVAAFVGNECRGVGKLSYLPELDKTLISMFVYSNSSTSLTTQDLGEKVEYRIFDASQNRVFRHYAPIAFGQDSILGSFEQTYKFSNIAPDNTFFVAAYPNPFETKFKVNIQSDKAQTYTLRLVDIAGHKLMEQSIEKETAETTVIMNPQALNLSSGVYFLQVIGSLGETTTIKLMK